MCQPLLRLCYRYRRTCRFCSLDYVFLKYSHHIATKDLTMSDDYSPHPHGQPVPGVFPGPAENVDQQQPVSHSQEVPQGYVQSGFPGYQHAVPNGYMQPVSEPGSSYEGGQGYAPAPASAEGMLYPQVTPLAGAEELSAKPKKKGLIALIVLLVLGLIGGGIFLSVRLLGASGGQWQMEADFPFIHRPADGWNEGYEQAWELEGADTATADGDYMVASFPHADHEDAADLVGYRVSAYSEPEELWRLERNDRFIPEYWREGVVYGRFWEDGHRENTRYSLDARTGQLEELNLDGMESSAKYIRMTYRPNFYGACETAEGENNAGYSIAFADVVGEGCRAFDYDGKKKWELTASEMPSEGLHMLNAQTGEIVTLQEKAPEDYPITFFLGAYQHAEVFHSLFEFQGVVVRDREGQEIERFDLPQRDDKWEDIDTISLQSRPNEVTDALKKLAEGDNTLWDTRLRAMHDWEKGRITLFFPNGKQKEVDPSGEEGLKWHLIVPSPSVNVASGMVTYSEEKNGRFEGIALVNFFENESGLPLPEVSPQRPALLPQPDLLIHMPEFTGRRGESKGLTAYRPKG